MLPEGEDGEGRKRSGEGVFNGGGGIVPSPISAENRDRYGCVEKPRNMKYLLRRLTDGNDAGDTLLKKVMMPLPTSLQRNISHFHSSTSLFDRDRFKDSPKNKYYQ